MKDGGGTVDINKWGVFTTMCGEKFLATGPTQDEAVWWEHATTSDRSVLLHSAISFRIELMPQQGGVVRMPFVGGIDLLSAPVDVHARVCNVYKLSSATEADREQYAKLIRHAIDQLAAARARQSGLVIP
jgi:hypothetical protein